MHTVSSGWWFGGVSFVCLLSWVLLLLLVGLFVVLCLVGVFVYLFIGGFFRTKMCRIFLHTQKIWNHLEGYHNIEYLLKEWVRVVILSQQTYVWVDENNILVPAAWMETLTAHAFTGVICRQYCVIKLDIINHRCKRRGNMSWQLF